MPAPRRSLMLQLILIGLVTAACANKEKKNDETAADSDLYSMESSDSSQKSSDVLFDDGSGGAPAKEEVVKTESSAEQSPVEPQEVVDVQVDPDKTGVYRVQKDNETLMMIAFKIYGDYGRWRHIAAMNKEMFDHRYVIKKGMMLKFAVPESEFKYEPKGEPYIIKWGETLSSISMEVYSTFNRWKQLWHNNRPLIRHPDKIFAGFTLYYVPDNSKKKKESLPDLASSNPGPELVSPEPVESASTAPVDPKVELEQLETAPAAAESGTVDTATQASNVPAEEKQIDGGVEQTSDRNPTSL